MSHSAEDDDPEGFAITGERAALDGGGEGIPAHDYVAGPLAGDGDDRLVGDDDIEFDSDDAEDDGFDDDFDTASFDGDDFNDDAFDDDEDDEDDEDGPEPILSIIASHIGDDGMLPRGFSLISFAPGYEDITDGLNDLARSQSAYIDDEGDEGEGDGAYLASSQYADGFADGMELYGAGVEDPTPEQVVAIHGLIHAIKDNDEGTAIDLLNDLVDSLPAIEAEETMIQAISDEADDQRFLSNLLRVGVTLVARGADPFTVKYGLIMIEKFGLPDPVKDMLRILGRCDEFTLFVVTAMEGFPDANDEIFDLATHVEGWGRIHCVDALEPETDEQRAWLLHEGWHNTTGAVYSVVPCFEKGGAAQLLADGDLTDEEFADIARMLTVLIEQDDAGAPGIFALEDADTIVEDFLAVAARRSQEGRLTDDEQTAVSNNKVSLTWSISGDFRRRYNTARFVQEFLQSGTFSIDGHSFLRIEQEREEDETLRRLEETVNSYRPFVETLDALGVTAKWDPEKMTPKELNDLDFMHAIFVEKKPLEGVELKSPVVNFNIQGAQVYALARKREEGGYELIDILSDRLVVVFDYPDQKAIDKDLGFDPVPALMALGEEEFAKAVNLKPDKFSEQLDRFPITAGNQTPLNQKVLEMLSAYDKGAKQPQALLACAAILARKLFEFDADSQTYLLNLMQSLKRSRELDDGEKDLLRNLVIDAHERYVQAAAYALLGDDDMARRCLERCTEAEKAQIENYPISRFFRDEGIDS